MYDTYMYIPMYVLDRLGKAYFISLFRISQLLIPNKNVTLSKQASFPNLFVADYVCVCVCVSVCICTIRMCVCVAG